MNRKQNAIYLNQVARVLTPAAMVIFLTMEIVDSQEGIGLWIYPVALAALFTSVGIEAWGMVSGANVEKSWLLNRSKLSSSIQLVLYVAVTMWLLRSNPTLVALPIVAALVYVSAALYDSLNNHQTKQETDRRQSLAIQLRQQEAQAQRDHEARLKQMELDAQAKIALETKHGDNETAVKLARIQVRKEVAATVSHSFPMKPEETEGNKKETMKQLWKPGMKPTELAALAGVSKGYASKYINNGAMKHYQERA